MKWKEEEIEFLKENYPKNIPLSEISNKIGKSLRAISHKAARIEISRPRYPSNQLSKRQPRKVIEQRYYLKNKEKLYEKKRNRINKRREELKKMSGGKCKICGYNKCLSALEFHHNSGEKEGHVSKLIMDFSMQKSLKEIKKCILLCANCHRELHSRGA
jgi:hypothetical protein